MGTKKTKKIQELTSELDEIKATPEGAAIVDFITQFTWSSSGNKFSRFVSEMNPLSIPFSDFSPVWQSVRLGRDDVINQCMSEVKHVNDFCARERKESKQRLAYYCYGVSVDNELDQEDQNFIHKKFYHEMNVSIAGWYLVGLILDGVHAAPFTVSDKVVSLTMFGEYVRFNHQELMEALHISTSWTSYGIAVEVLRRVDEILAATTNLAWSDGFCVKVDDLIDGDEN